MRNLINRLICAAAVSLTFLSAIKSVDAGLVSYADFSTWNAVVSGVTSETIPDPSPSLYESFGAGNVSHTYGSLTFSQSTALNNQDSSLAFFNIGTLTSGGPAVITSQYTNQPAGDESVNILIEFSSAVHGFALNYGTAEGQDVTFTLSNGHSFTQSSTQGFYQASDFAGATDDTAFTSVLVTASYIEVSLNINNISSATKLVPEPSTLALLGVGGFGISITTLRRRMAK